MIRSILGFALIAVAAWVALQLVFGVLGTLIGLAITLLVFAAFGHVFYLVLRLVSPGTAARVREMIRGRPANVA